MTKTLYGIKQKSTGLYFGGFDSEQNVLWVHEAFAKAMDRLFANAQATLLAIHHHDVQRKPVAVAA